MMYAVPIQNYEDLWLTMTMDQKAKSIMQRLQESDENNAIHGGFVGGEDITNLITLLRNSNYNNLQDVDVLNNTIESIATLLTNSSLAKSLKKIEIFPSSIFTWATTTNNFSLYKALFRFSNMCTQSYNACKFSIQ